MKKGISLLLALLMIATCSFSLIACENKNPDKHNDELDKIPEKPNDDKEEDKGPTLIVPPEKDYHRGTVDFSELSYMRPNIAGVLSLFDELTATVKADSTPIEDIKEDFYTLFKHVNNIQSMQALSYINVSKDSSNKFWSEENAYITSNMTTVLDKLDSLKIACANSSKKADYEKDIVGLGSLNAYVDLGELTEEHKLLLKKEEELINQYHSFSPENVEITYDGKTDTVVKMLEEVEKKYGKESEKYFKRKTLYYSLFNQKVAELSQPIYVDLVKVRNQIAKVEGFNNYIELVFDRENSGFTPQDYWGFIQDVISYVVPVAQSLEDSVFSPFFATTRRDDLSTVELLNSLYKVYGKMDAKIQDIFAYMLQHKLYDIDVENPNRYNGAFTEYIPSNNSPFIFLTTEGKVDDYFTFSHEFGKFIDGFVFSTLGGPEDTEEVIAQSFELLTLLKLKGNVSEETYRYLEYYRLRKVFDQIISQTYLSLFEYYTYLLPYNEISLETVSNAASKASLDIFGYEAMTLNQAVNVLTMEHVLYAKSYTPATVVALEIFFKEMDKSGSGIDTFKIIVDRRHVSATFEDFLIESGLTSPFEEFRLKNIADKIHYFITGYHHFKEGDSTVDAA